MTLENLHGSRELEFESRPIPGDVYQALDEEIELAYDSQYFFQLSLEGLHRIWSNSTFMAWANDSIDLYVEHSAEVANMTTENPAAFSKLYFAMLDGCVLGLHTSMAVLPEDAQRDVYHSWPIIVSPQEEHETDEAYISRVATEIDDIDFELDYAFTELEPQQSRSILRAGDLYGDEHTPQERSIFMRGIELSHDAVIRVLREQREQLESEAA
jgi:hypothetical protein